MYQLVESEVNDGWEKFDGTIETEILKESVSVFPHRLAVKSSFSLHVSLPASGGITEWWQLDLKDCIDPRRNNQ